MKPKRDGQLYDLYIETLIKTSFVVAKLRENRYIFITYIIINKICAALRSQKCMAGILGSPKNMCISWLHKIPFLPYGKKRFDFPPTFQPWTVS